MKPENFTDELVSFSRVVILQRLGFILEKAVGKQDLADKLYTMMSNKYHEWYRQHIYVNGEIVYPGRKQT